MLENVSSTKKSIADSKKKYCIRRFEISDTKILRKSEISEYEAILDFFGFWIRMTTSIALVRIPYVLPLLFKFRGNVYYKGGGTQDLCSASAACWWYENPESPRKVERDAHFKESCQF